MYKIYCKSEKAKNDYGEPLFVEFTSQKEAKEMLDWLVRHDVNKNWLYEVVDISRMCGVPNEKTQQAMKDADEGKNLTHYKNAVGTKWLDEEMFKSMGAYE